MRKLFPSAAFGDFGDNGQLEEFMLKGLDHEQNPEYEAKQADQQIDTDPHKTETEEAATYKENSPDVVKKGDGAEDDNGLCGMEFHERALVDEKKDNPGDPAERV